MARADATSSDTPTAAAAPAANATQQALRKLGLTRDMDLVLHLPLRWEDATRLVRLADAQVGEVVQFEATVVACEVVTRARRQLVATVEDGGVRCELRFFHFYPGTRRALQPGSRLRVRGELRLGLFGRTIMHPTLSAAGAPLPEALTPVYPTVAGLPQHVLRRAIAQALERVDLSPTVPAEFLDETLLSPAWNTHSALMFLHRPPAAATLATLDDRRHPAWQCLKAEELLAQQLAQVIARRERARLRAPVLRAGREPASLPARLQAALPFSLTAAQVRVAEEIAQDLARSTPMHRLLQGDVGAGKTVVAALAAAVAIEAGWQCALMAPTELLAEQHFGKLVGWLAPLGVEVAWLTGSQKKAERAAALARIAAGTAQLVVGTHAVISEQVRFARLGLALIDEQHRFGVAQRLALRDKQGEAGVEPHLLMMTATPIPRTLAMSYYADLDVSTLDELPPGRTPVLTRVLANSRRSEVIERIRGQLAQGRQAYWVCPLIEESEALTLRNATETQAELAAALPGVAVALLHARMPAADKRAVMADFAAGRIGVLVSTTVIEVGVDVPNASLMVIEHAERFGLSQLHQLRGRVGRGSAASACVLLYEAPEGGRLGEAARERLRAMLETNDGFEIARRDLAIRGPGEFLGARQSGTPMLRFADLATDTSLLEWARRVAPQLLAQHPELAARHVQRWLGGKSDFLKA